MYSILTYIIYGLLFLKQFEPTLWDFEYFVKFIKRQ